MPSIEEFAYELPDAAIAQTPCEPRDAARLLDATVDPPCHRHVRDLPELLGPGDVVVVNDTRVIPARLGLSKATGGSVEVLLLAPSPSHGEEAWTALVRPSRRVRPGTVLTDRHGHAALEVADDLGEGLRVVRPSGPSPLLDLASRIGTVPLPPYITTDLADPERYQTVYARHDRSVAAPTAGLHFTAELLERCRETGAEVLAVELAVGLGTFRPIMVDDVTEHRMHAEQYLVPEDVMRSCEGAERVIAIGTTAVRALESAAAGELTGSTDLFISPGFEFRVVDVLLTNFHQPRSSLLVMLAAFAGDRWRELYREALSVGYRFLSFGDAMIVGRATDR